MNPYEALGVPHDATDAQIKAAYRNRSKEAHPDTGGDAEAFAELKAAYDVLRNPHARTHYDATGEILTRQADNEAAAVLSMIAAAVEDVLIKVGPAYAEVDLVKAACEVIEGQKRDRAKKGAAGRDLRAKWADMRDRCTVDGGGENYMARIFEARISDIDHMLRVHAEADALADRALAILAGHRYRADAPKKRGVGQTTYQSAMAEMYSGGR